MKKITAFLLFFAVAAAVCSARDIEGKVYFVHGGDEEPAYMATVYWLEQNRAVEVGEDGKFTMNIGKASEATFIAAYIGYTRDTVHIDGTVSDVVMKLYPENELESVNVVGKQEGNYLSKVSSIRTEVISAAGLCKMACCNLAESFENSASVSVGYSDAVTGSRQIRLLGLSGIYTAMLDENRPVMRGLASPFGLSYIPGQWLESIQIAKGPSSVVNGMEAITGQINMEHRKPTAEQPLFVNLFLSSALRTEANVASSLQLNDRWSTVLMGHFSTDPMKHDQDGDGFRDEPNTMQFNFTNRWLYMGENGMQIRFGLKAVHDDRVSGQMGYDRGKTSSYENNLWGSEIRNRTVNGFFKFGMPVSADENDNIAVIADYSYYQTNSFFGMKKYDGFQHSAFVNAMFQSQVNDSHKYILGLTAKYDGIDETLNDWYNASSNPDVVDPQTATFSPGRKETSVGAYGEYTYHWNDRLTAIGGLRLDYDFTYGWLFSPRANLKYSFTDNLVFRAAGGRGFRTPNAIADNLGILSTGYQIKGLDTRLDIEDAWTYGANLTAYFKLGYGDDAYVSFDYFRTDFLRQVIVDQEAETGAVCFYNLGGGQSFTDTYQIDFSMQPIERFTVMLTARYTNAKVDLKGQGLVDRPLMSKFKGVLNLQYATRLNKWTFDFTVQLNGPARLPQVEGVEAEYSPWYPMLFAQVTRKLKGFDIYVGAENLLNYRQKNPILDYENPYSSNFNSTVIWGPLMGIKVYAGMRFTLWK